MVEAGGDCCFFEVGFDDFWGGYECGCFLACLAEHSVGEVDGGDGAVDSDALAELWQEYSGACAEVEDVLARLHVDGREELVYFFGQ